MAHGEKNRDEQKLQRPSHKAKTTPPSNICVSHKTENVKGQSEMEINTELINEDNLYR